MLRAIDAIDSLNTKQVSKINKQEKFTTSKPQIQENDLQPLQTIPYGYVSFKGNDDYNGLPLHQEAREILDKAKDLAKNLGHKEISPQHIIQIALGDLEDFITLHKAKQEGNLNIEIPAPAILNVANNYANKDLFTDETRREYFLEQVRYLNDMNVDSLENLPQKEGKRSIFKHIFKDINLSKTLENNLANIGTEISAFGLVGTAFNTLTHSNILYTSDFLLNLSRYSIYKVQDDFDENYLKQYDNRALEVWDKLALGASLFVTSKNKEERDRIEASIINTLDKEKQGNFNSNNTIIYSFAPETTIDNILEEAQRIKSANPDKKIILMLDYDDVINKIVVGNENGAAAKKEDLFGISELDKENIRFVLFQDEGSYEELMLTPIVKKQYANFIQYSVPPIQSYEVAEILSENDYLLENVKLNFTEDAKNKAIILADKLEGCYPDKAIDLMERISEYFSGSVEEITTKEVEEFSYIANDIFNQDSSEMQIVYNTGKTLSSYYGKETTKKDIITLVEQIKTCNVGTQGIIITAKDQEAGAGKKYTAEVIAGEAKVPFLEINPADFAISNTQIEGESKMHPANYIRKAFNELKFAAKQNPYKTAILYISNFEDLLLTDIDYHGYKQARAQLTKEIEFARSSDVNILVMGSTFEELSDYVPIFIKDFNRKITVDSPAFNKASRKEVIENLIEKEKIVLDYNKRLGKQGFINKLVKLTEYCSYVEIKNLISKTVQITIERNKEASGIGEFIEAFLQIQTGRTSNPEMPLYNKEATTSHECGHATNLEVMNNLYKSKGKPWHKFRDVNFITLDPRGGFLGAVFEGKDENSDYPFEAMFAGIVCSYGGYSCEKMFFNMDGSAGISQDLAQATAAAKKGVEYFGLGYNTGKISNAAGLKASKYNENVFSDIEVILTNAQIASDLITEYYQDFNIDFTHKYAQLIGSNNCMIDGDDFRKQLQKWISSRPKAFKEDLAVLEDILMDIIKCTKNGQIYGKIKTVIK